MRSCCYFVHLLSITLLAVFLSPGAAPAQTCEPWVAKVVSVQGTVEAQRLGEPQWQPAKFHDTYCPGDTIRVQERSRADLALMNQSVLRLNANTTITLEGVTGRTHLSGQSAQGGRTFLQPWSPQPGSAYPLYRCRGQGNGVFHQCDGPSDLPVDI